MFYKRYLHGLAAVRYAAMLLAVVCFIAACSHGLKPSGTSLDADTATVKTTGLSSQGVYLMSANTALRYWSAQSGAVKYRLRGHVPVQFGLAGLAKQLRAVRATGGLIEGVPSTAGTLRIKVATMDKSDAILDDRT